MAVLPDPQRLSLEVALLLRRAEGPPAKQHAISVAVLTVLRRVAQSGPIVLALDDAQWIDSPSARALVWVLFLLASYGPLRLGS